MGEPSALLVTVSVAVTGALVTGVKLIVTLRSSEAASDPVNPFHENVELDPGNDTASVLPVLFLIPSNLVAVVPVCTGPNLRTVGLKANVGQACHGSTPSGHLPRTISPSLSVNGSCQRD
jgi:hypothetical protein